MDLGLPLTGRAEELAFLEDAVRRRSGALVAGAAGVGKSRLVHELCGRLAGWHVARTTVSASTAHLPLAGLAGLALESVEAVALDRGELFARLIGELRARSADQPLVVVVDDAHLLDEVSAAFLHQLVVARAAAVVLVVRSREPAPRSLLSIVKDQLVPRLELQPLGRAEFARLTEAALGGPAEPATHAELWRYADGNALFLRELLGDALERRTLERVDGRWRWSPSWSVGPRLAELVAERMGRLDERRRELIELIAVGEPLGPAVVERLLPGVDLAEEEARGLVTCEESGGRVEVRAGHPLFTEMVRAQLPVLRRRRLQRRIAEALEETGLHRRGDRLRAAVLRVESGSASDAAELGRAAREARRQFDPGLARRLALRSLELEPSFDAALVAAGALNDLGCFADAAQALDRLAGSEPDDAGRQELARERAWAVFHGPEGLDGARRILAAVETGPAGPGVRLAARGALALMLTYVGRFLDAAEIGMPLLDADVDDVHRLSYLAPVGACLVMSGRTDRALDLCAQLEPIADRHRDDQPRAHGLLWQMRANALLLAGRVDEAVTTLEGPLAPDADPLLGAGDLAYARTKLGLALLLQGRPRTAADQLALAAEVLRGEDPDNCLAWCLSLAAQARAQQGELDAARALAAEAAAYDGPLGAVFAGDAQRARAWVAAAEGRLTDAAAELVGAAEEQLARAQPSFALFALHDAVRLGEHRLADEVVEVAGRLDGPGPVAVALHAAGLCAGDPDRLQRAADAFAALGWSPASAEAAAHAAAAYAGAGLHARATAAGALRDDRLARCEAPLRATLPAPAGAPRLTRREREVAALAAQRHSNADIARLLHLSVRTVESHLYAVYAKLGLSDRNELSAALLDQ